LAEDIQIIYSGDVDYDEWKKQFKCQHCSDCCTNFRSTGKIDTVEGMIDILQWSQFPIPIKLPETITVQLIIKDAPCQHFNPISKLCMDYLNRPELCRNFFCEKSRIK
jgi:Fe-S-cluster containining protein